MGVDAFAADQVFYFLTAKTGVQNTGQPAPLIGTKDDYLQTLEETHGELKTDRVTNPFGISFDFYSVDGSFATGFGLELTYYNKKYEFDDHSSVKLEMQSILYGFSTFYRGEIWFPYFAFGSGNYNVKFTEELSGSGDTPDTKATFSDSAKSVLYYELGSRFPIDEFGLQLSYRYISAPIVIQTIGNDLELGGTTLFLGFYYSY